MRAAVVAASLALCKPTHAAFELPSFLFILADVSVAPPRTHHRHCQLPASRAAACSRRPLTHLHPRSDPCLVYLTQDIGWADFGYHSGSTANTPHVTEWTKQPGTMVMHDFHSGGTHCTPTRASILTGRTPFRDCVFGTKGADGDDMTEMIDNFTFAPKRTWTIGNAVRQASPDYFSQHFGKVRTDACLLRRLCPVGAASANATR